VIDDNQFRQYLTDFLARKGNGIDDLRKQVDNSFGEPHLVAAAGSVLQGFGNEESDVDVLALVDAPRVTDLPISSHVLDMPVDVNYIDVTWMRSAGDDVLAGWLPTAVGLSQEQWRAAYRRVTKIGRLAYGLPLAGDPALFDWQEQLRKAFPWHASRWWRAECLRQLTAARLLASGRPLLAAQRYCDAGMAALESAAAAMNEAYTGPKWIGAKLRRIGDPVLESAFQRLIEIPVTTADAGAYGTDAEQIVTALTSADPLPGDPYVLLTLHEGVQREEVLGLVLLHRFGARGVESDDPAFGIAGEQGVVWHGLMSAITDAVHMMLTQGLAWLTVREDASL
jgi:hypothetical protein